MDAIPNQVSALKLCHQGKVRNTYEVPGQNAMRLVVATDRISIFDFVLDAHVPGKGEILTAMNVFWARMFDDYRQDIIGFGAHIDEYVPESLRGNPILQKQATIVTNLDMYPIEAIVRGYLTGTGLKAYRETGVVCGHRLPKGLGEASQLPRPIFTPTTKATEGHDEHIDINSVRERYGSYVETFVLQIFDRSTRYANERGIIIADTKFELGSRDGSLFLADERLTPDSSRFWDKDDWEAAHHEKRSPTSFDKQVVRDWGIRLGINKRDPRNAEDHAWVRAQIVPVELIRETAARYHIIFERLTGYTLKAFQEEVMEIRL
ncbi:MAG: phosphoribosylaminoimidazolesuccinocarboxamide synthase [Minisyncoccia bacterium]